MDNLINQYSLVFAGFSAIYFILNGAFQLKKWFFGDKEEAEKEKFKEIKEKLKETELTICSIQNTLNNVGKLELRITSLEDDCKDMKKNINELSLYKAKLEIHLYNLKENFNKIIELIESTKKN